MKVTVLMLLVAIAAVSWAQSRFEPRDATDEEKLWLVLFARIVSTEIHEDGGSSMTSEAEASSTLSQQVGISQAAAEKFVRYVHRSFADLERLSNAAHADLCANLETYKTSREAFADKVERDHTGYQAAQDAIVANMSTVLSPEDEEKLRFWALELEPTPVMGGPSSTEIVDMIRSGTLSGYADRIEQTCEDGRPRQ